VRPLRAPPGLRNKRKRRENPVCYGRRVRITKKLGSTRARLLCAHSGVHALPVTVCPHPATPKMVQPGAPVFQGRCEPCPCQLSSKSISGLSAPGAIWLGPWIIAVNSPAHGTRRTGLMKVVVSVELPGFARGSCLRRDTGVIAMFSTQAAPLERKAALRLPTTTSRLSKTPLLQLSWRRYRIETGSPGTRVQRPTSLVHRDTGRLRPSLLLR
jgi:hypothetical protein